jgi:DNA repair exonuclease SbcCD ATPase subunit
LTLVLGHNVDTAGNPTRNGAGKSAILQAIAYGLYGKPLTKIKIGNLCNNVNNKAMLVTVEFERDGTVYRIERGQKPNVLRLFKNDTEQKFQSDEAQGENRHTQTEIDRLIGMSLGLFRYLVGLNTFSTPFPSLGSAEQRSLFEELNGTTQLSARAATLKVLLDETKETIRNHEAQIRAITDSNTRIEVAIKRAQDLSEKWQAHHEEAIEDLHASIDALRSIDFEAEIAAFDLVDAYTAAKRDLTTRQDALGRDLAALRKDLARSEQEASRARSEAAGGAVAAQVKRLEDEITRKQRDSSRHTKTVEKHAEEIARLNADLGASDESVCVCCGQALTGTDHLATVVASLKAQMEAAEKKLQHEEAEIVARQAEIAEIQAEIAEVQAAALSRQSEFEEQARVSDARATDLRGQIAQTETAIATIKAEVRNLGDPPETLYASRDEVYRTKQKHDTLLRDLATEEQKENPYTAQVQSLRATLQVVDYEPLNEAQNLFKHQELLHKLLTSRDSFIRKRIVDQNLAYLNQRLSFYLDKLGLPHEVKFLQDLSIDISLLGKDYDFEQLSRGEMNRVIMATSWSFRDIWESLNTSMNLIWIDEMLDQGTDTQGVEAAVAILKSMVRDRQKSVFLVSHKDELVSRIDRILLVSKENHFTKFEDDASLD